MRRATRGLIPALLVWTLLLAGCQENLTGMEPDLAKEAMSGTTMGNGATLGGMIWADGELFGTVGTPTAFKPTAGRFTELYNTGGNGTFKDGVSAISAAKPGDQDFTGGRWHVNLLRPEVDPTKYANATRVEELDLSDFVSTDTYFECPLLPRRGNDH